MKSSFLRTFLILSTLSLGACGEGWEMQRTEEYLPYGNSRTAGSGVVYVRAKLLPKKELNIEPAQEVVEEKPVFEEKAPEPEVAEEVRVDEVEPVLDAEEIFKEAQTKGGAPKAAALTENKEEKAELKAEDYIEEAPKKAKVDIEKAPANPVAEVKTEDLNHDEKVEEVVKEEFGNFSTEIVSPKTDKAEGVFPSEGKETLDIIYTDPLGNL
ncbi:MAG: hypothetical protein GC137_09220 [Alphaproteobacteria bacterium]|nr:hypothetical protein [Alphaproteobacteria bacterium]